jgi:ectoine hydroxylase-related dioxygenase (phytanoyl-CoA dioxygenase family)
LHKTPSSTNITLGIERMTASETQSVAGYAAAIERDGFAIVRDALNADLLTALADAVESVQDGPGVRSRDGIYAVRNLLGLAPGVQRALVAPAIKSLVESCLGAQALLVGALYLDKRPNANWKVPWHQDATITVRERLETTGFGPWTMKAGIHHVQAPPYVLYDLLCLRVHLDGCREDEGALKVIPGSHNFGRLPTDSIPQFTRDATVESCPIPQGGLLAMRPLLLHASFAARTARSQRVIHLSFASRTLPAPLQWYEAHSIASI